MGSHLLAISVGPVQEFIAAARRTRDLWFGSFVLSEISKAVARAVRGAGGELIFPAPGGNLEPNSDLDVANVVLTEVPEGRNARDVAGEAKRAAQRAWKGFADAVIRDEHIRSVIRCDPSSEHGDLWEEQVGDVVEFYAAWAPRVGNYEDDRARVMRLLAGRKNCRDFFKAIPHIQLPKSSLDGMRDTVLIGPAKNQDPQTYRDSWPKATRRKLRVRTGEQLDVVGVVKRAWKPEGKEDRYPSVSRVAADSWLRGCRGRLAGLIAACRALNEREREPVIRRIDTARHPHYEDFPFEGTAVFRNRYHELREEAELTPEDLSPVGEALSALVREAGEPNPYLAVLVADGDNMGATISKLVSREEHQRFSAELSKFASQSEEIVNDHRGVLVYAGGDDVFAFVPVDRCLDCARALHDAFGALMTRLVETLNQNRDKKLEGGMSLSVGVAIGHFLENLEDLREYARAAEKHAKTAADGSKDALAVHLYKRGGGPVTVRDRWGQRVNEKWADVPDKRITGLAVMLAEGLLPNRLAADLHGMARVYEKWPRTTEDERKRVKDAIAGDVLRVVAAKKARGGGDIGERLQPALARVTDAASLRQLAEELLIARQIAVACRQAEGKHGDGGEK